MERPENKNIFSKIGFINVIKFIYTLNYTIQFFIFLFLIYIIKSDEMLKSFCIISTVFKISKIISMFIVESDQENKDIFFLSQVITIMGFIWNLKGIMVFYSTDFYQNWVLKLCIWDIFSSIAPYIFLIILLIITFFLPPRFSDYEFPNDFVEDKNCNICLKDYEDGEKIRILHCGHYFHKSCVHEWFLVDRNCPICKRPIDFFLYVLAIIKDFK